jgi:hypothetical protein
MEPRFGVDFSGVRVHTSHEAAALNQAVGAQAFTHGQDIYFGAGKSPEVSDLTAHELTHVVQQTRGSRISSLSHPPVQSMQSKCAACSLRDPIAAACPTCTSGASRDKAETVALLRSSNLWLSPASYSGRERTIIADSIIGDSITRLQRLTNDSAILTFPPSHATTRFIQRVAGADDVAIGAVLAWCASGTAVTLVIDEIFQVGKWLIWGSGPFQQNWCATLFSALFGCVFGVAGGAAERMIFGEAATLGAAGFLRWAQQKLLMAGYSQVAGKVGLAIAKAGC